LPPEAWIESEIPQAHKAGVIVIASVGHTLPESSRLVESVVASGAAMVELVSYDEADLAPMVADARRRLSCPILVKLSPNGRDLVETARRCVAAGADAITACDSVGPVLRIDIRTGRPLLGGADGAGWLSGSAIKPLILQRVAELRRALTCPIVGLGGVTDAADAVEMLMAGANFVGLCSALILRGPEYLGALRQETAALIAKLGYADVAAVSGKAIPFLTAAEQAERLVFAYNADQCIGCGQCVKVCCYQARTLTAEKTMSVNTQECRDCGLCMAVCPTQALTVAGV
jgi:dihydroorotate dehydrogenase (fumarate)